MTRLRVGSARERLSRTIDGLGMHIEEAVLDTVTALNVHGFGTTASCGGHTDRGLPYPWVDVSSPLAAENSTLGSRYRTLWKQYQDNRKQATEMPAEDKQELEEIIRQDMAENQKSLERPRALLEEYRTNVQPGSSLWLSRRGRNAGRLQPTHELAERHHKVEEIAAWRAAADPDQVESDLRIFQEEMRLFAEYLKQLQPE